jgi:hypothetical protein
MDRSHQEYKKSSKQHTLKERLMNDMLSLFDEFVMKAITMTENFLQSDFSSEINFEAFTSNRERLLMVIDQISKQIDWVNVTDSSKAEINRRIEYIKKLDEKVVVKLQEYQEEVRQEIERTVRQKDNIKGYNLNDVK